MHRENRGGRSLKVDDHEVIPAEATDLKYVDSLIAKRMSSISAVDREKTYLDVHGISSDENKETPELVHKSLLQVQYEIGRLTEKEAYDLAVSMDRTYVCNPDFVLAFLRADVFDAKRAAARLARHFQLKLKLFGKDRLVVDITQDDLDKDDMEALYSGYGRFLPNKDRAGRTINFVLAGKKSTTISMLRRAFYNSMVELQDPDFQKKGYVLVAYSFNNGRGIGGQADGNYKFPKLTESLPIRVSALHVCHDGTLKRENISMVKAGLNSQAQLRTRDHYGTHEEVMSILQGHGIERGIIPIAEGGEITDLGAHRQRLLAQRSAERWAKPRRRIVHVPGEHDVLFGKGSPIQNHAGNRALRSLVLEYHERYFRAEKGQKIKIAQEIVDIIITQNSGVFLREDDGVWVTVENSVARTKVSAAFRTLRMDQKRRTAKPSVKVGYSAYQLY
ncbi:unnamed protein product [Cylindrotheca closterium]|uniref:DUF6824 domain-containing protein n=1 Tax=Cylindrotheca closterium TaxID=2856 RepID=A0AAD2GEP4_9STRA|nr:unnamed protein product [Cylindrotheca closterium]